MVNADDFGKWPRCWRPFKPHTEGPWGLHKYIRGAAWLFATLAASARALLAASALWAGHSALSQLWVTARHVCHTLPVAAFRDCESKWTFLNSRQINIPTGWEIKSHGNARLPSMSEITGTFSRANPCLCLSLIRYRLCLFIRLRSVLNCQNKYFILPHPVMKVKLALRRLKPAFRDFNTIKLTIAL